MLLSLSFCSKINKQHFTYGTLSLDSQYAVRSLTTGGISSCCNTSPVTFCFFSELSQSHCPFSFKLRKKNLEKKNQNKSSWTHCHVTGNFMPLSYEATFFFVMSCTAPTMQLRGKSDKLLDSHCWLSLQNLQKCSVCPRACQTSLPNPSVGLIKDIRNESLGPENVQEPSQLQQQSNYTIFKFESWEYISVT